MLTTPSIAATSSALIFLPTPVHSPSHTAPCSLNSSPLVRSRCRRVCDSRYCLLSSLALSQSTLIAADGRVRSFGRRVERRERNAGSCDRAKLTFVVSGACDGAPTPRDFAEGFSFRNSNFDGAVAALTAPDSASSLLDSEEVCLEDAVER